MRFRAWKTLWILILFLAGCGGGGNSELSGTLALTATQSLEPGATGTAVATYADSKGRNPQGLEISFSTDRPDIVALSATTQSVGSDGKASVTFQAVSVAADTVIKIYSKTGGLSQFQQVTIKATPGTTAPPPISVVDKTPNAISFISATPTTISLKGTGGASRSETSVVTFEVRDTTGQALSNQTVDFSLNTSVGGITMLPSSATTDGSGRVQTIVNAGIVSTTVRVSAQVRGTSIFTQSDQLTVSTGLPDQDSLSISFSNLNSESFDHDGVAVKVTARLADHFNNPVPDGTAVYFTTEAGAIQPTCTTVNGACSVDWTSQSPRIADGRFTVLVYAVGEESFTDLNGNGVADSGEFTDTSEAYRDDNFNRVRDANEPFIDFNSDGVFNGPDGIFNGVLRPSTVQGAKSKHIFSNSELVMSTDAALITCNPSPITAPGSMLITVTDLNGNTMASGTKITITAPFGTLTGFTDYTVPQNTGHGVTLPVNLAAGSTPKLQSGLLDISVTSPGGLVTSLMVPVTGNF